MSYIFIGETSEQWNERELRERISMLDKKLAAALAHNRALEAANRELREALANLVERIDFNGGIGDYKGGPLFVMRNARELLERGK